jgi:hypothetical protein
MLLLVILLELLAHIGSLFWRPVTRVTGTVLDRSTGRPIPRATVKVVAGGALVLFGGSSEDRTYARGEFALGVRGAPYGTLTVRADGYAPDTLVTIDRLAGRYEFRLSPRP